MRISYNEFHISKKIRDLCNFNEGLFASSGNVVFANMKNVRDFQLKFNQLLKNKKLEDKQVSAGNLNAMGLIDEIMHYVCMLYRRDIHHSIISDFYYALEKKYTKEKFDEFLLFFMKEFPPVEVYKGNITAEDFLNKTSIDIGTALQRPNREQLIEELILLHLANENPAFNQFKLLFDDSNLARNKIYKEGWAIICGIAKTLPSFGPFNHDLISLLKEPMVFAPNSLKDQLDYIQRHWKDMLGEWIKRLLSGMDTISEEEKAAWAPINGGGSNGPDMAPFSYDDLIKEYERYSPDKDWMPKVILMAKTVLVWLYQLTKKYGYPIERLDQIPDAELDTLRDEGFTGLWLIGLWERSSASKRIKQLCGNPEAAASAYSLYDYNIAANIGGWDALANLRQRLWQRGIRLASDMVPNHTGMDSDWVMNKPDLFVQRRDNPFPQYTYNGENLSHDSRTSVYLEDHYYSKNDCSVVFKRVDNSTGDVRYIYHGNDGTGLPWNDTAQIDFLNPEAREEVIQEIIHVARNFPIIRFDAAMVLAKKHIRRLWYPEPGHGGDIATRSETGLSSEQFNNAIPNEFWREVVDRIAKEVPDTLLLAEAFWMMEGYFVRTLGMHRVYNSAFMNMLKKEENQKYRDTVKNTITFDPQILKRYVNFMNNPDEETAIAQFGDGDKYFGVCTLMITMPGLPMFGHGQIEGFEEKYGMEYTRAYRDEQPKQYIVDRHWKDIFPLMKKRYIFANVENFLFYDLYDNGRVNENVFAYSNSSGTDRAVVFYNNKYEKASGWIKQSVPYAQKTNAEQSTLISRSISEGLELTAEEDKYTIFQENKSKLWYIRKSSDVCEKGLFVSLNGFEYQILLDIHQVSDLQDHRYKILCEYLNGKGSEDLEVEWQELFYKNMYIALGNFEQKTLEPIFKLFFTSDKKLSKIDLAEIKKIVENSKKEAEIFYTTSNDFISDTDKKILVPNAIKEFERRLLLIAKIHNNPYDKKTDLYTKTLCKSKNSEEFASILIKTFPEIEKSLICWSLTSLLSDNGKSKEWSFARKFNQFLLQNNICNIDLRNILQKTFILSKLTYSSKIKTDKILSSIVVELFQNNNARFLSRINFFNNIWWFNKEQSDESLALSILFMSLTAKEKDFDEILTIYKKISLAKLKAVYQCEPLILKFGTKTSKKVSSPQKVVSTKKTTELKKATKKKSVSTKNTVKK